MIWLLLGLLEVPCIVTDLWYIISKISERIVIKQGFYLPCSNSSILKEAVLSLAEREASKQKPQTKIK